MRRLVTGPALLALLEVWAATGSGSQYFMAHQHMINMFTTNVAGPPVPVYLLGARILDVIPIVQIAGNVALAFCAFSYDGRLTLVVTADAASFSDLDIFLKRCR